MTCAVCAHPTGNDPYRLRRGTLTLCLACEEELFEEEEGEAKAEDSEIEALKDEIGGLVSDTRSALIHLEDIKNRLEPKPKPKRKTA